MKKNKGLIFCAFFGVVVAVAGCSTTSTIEASSIDFRGVALGSSPRPEMISLEKWKPPYFGSSREISDAYQNPNESLKFGDLTIKEVIYEYYKDRLFSVEVDLYADKQKFCPKADEIVAALEQKYGVKMITRLDKPMEGAYMAIWQNSHARIVYNCKESLALNAIMIHDLRIQNEVDTQLAIIQRKIRNSTVNAIKQGL